MKKTKPLTLEQSIDQILRHYAPVFINKEQYIENCKKAILKKVEEMVGEDEELPSQSYESGESFRNELRQEVRARIKGENNILNSN